MMVLHVRKWLHLQPMWRTYLLKDAAGRAAEARNCLNGNGTSYGIGRITDPTDKVTLTNNGKKYALENAHLRAELDCGGNVTNLIEKSTGREALAGPANQLLLYVGHPTEHHAWD
jgi:hypothetical protein